MFTAFTSSNCRYSRGRSLASDFPLRVSLALQSVVSSYLGSGFQRPRGWLGFIETRRAAEEEEETPNVRGRVEIR